MKGIMDFNICMKEHIKKINPDKEKITSILRMCRIRQKVIGMIKLDEETASVIATDYYEIIKELLTALLLKNGLKSDNHECLISFFKKSYPEYDYETTAIHQLKEARNRASYDGVFIKKDYVERNKIEFEAIIKMLYELVEK